MTSRRYAVLVTVIVVALGYLMYLGVSEAGVYYVTVPELRAREDRAVERRFRVGGVVEAGSIRRDGTRVHFRLRDNVAPLPVVHEGVVTDLFVDEAEVVVEGVLRRDGTFESTVLLAQCPTRYEAMP